MKSTFTVKSLAEYLSCSQKVVLAHIHSGKLLATNVSSGQKPRWRISREAVERFMLENQNRTKPQRTRMQRKAVRRYV